MYSNVNFHWRIILYPHQLVFEIIFISNIFFPKGCNNNLELQSSRFYRNIIVSNTVSCSSRSHKQTNHDEQHLRYWNSSITRLVYLYNKSCHRDILSIHNQSGSDHIVHRLARTSSTKLISRSNSVFSPGDWLVDQISSVVTFIDCLYSLQ